MSVRRVVGGAGRPTSSFNASRQPTCLDVPGIPVIPNDVRDLALERGRSAIPRLSLEMTPAIGRWLQTNSVVVAFASQCTVAYPWPLVSTNAVCRAWSRLLTACAISGSPSWAPFDGAAFVVYSSAPSGPPNVQLNCL